MTKQDAFLATHLSLFVVRDGMQPNAANRRNNHLTIFYRLFANSTCAISASLVLVVAMNIRYRSLLGSIVSPLSKMKFMNSDWHRRSGLGHQQHHHAGQY
jgi:hypothetical protein